MVQRMQVRRTDEPGAPAAADLVPAAVSTARTDGAAAGAAQADDRHVQGPAAATGNEVIQQAGFRRSTRAFTVRKQRLEQGGWVYGGDAATAEVDKQCARRGWVRVSGIQAGFGADLLSLTFAVVSCTVAEVEGEAA
jgi:hypothetical protein